MIHRGHSAMETLVLVPQGAVGFLIGKGGEHIMAIREHSGAHIKLEPRENDIYNIGECVATVSGNLRQRVRAVELILSYFEQDLALCGYSNLTTSYSRSVGARIRRDGGMEQRKSTHGRVCGVNTNSGYASSTTQSMITPMVMPVSISSVGFRPMAPVSAQATITVSVDDVVAARLGADGCRSLIDMSIFSGAHVHMTRPGEYVPGTRCRWDWKWR